MNNMLHMAMSPQEAQPQSVENGCLLVSLSARLALLVKRITIHQHHRRTLSQCQAHLGKEAQNLQCIRCFGITIIRASLMQTFCIVAEQSPNAQLSRQRITCQSHVATPIPIRGCCSLLRKGSCLCSLKYIRLCVEVHKKAEVV